MTPADIAREAHRRHSANRQYCPHTPHPKQRQFLELDCLEALYGGAAGGGKSDALLMAALRYIRTPAYSAIIFRRTYTELALADAIMARSHEWLTGSDARWSGETKTWTFPSGATLTFGYLDGPYDHLRYQGAAFQYVGFDELTHWADDTQYLYLFTRLRKLEHSNVPLRVRAATNPGGRGHEWVKKRFVDAPEARIFVSATLEDNPSLDRETYETSLAAVDPVTYAQLRKGLWVRDKSGLVYSCLDEERDVVEVLPILPEGESWTYLLGCDFGVTDPTAFTVIAFTAHDPNVYVMRSEQWRDMSPSEAAEKAKEWSDEFGGFERIVGDLGGMGKAYEAEWRKRYYLPMHAAQKTDKLGYIKLLNGDLHHGRIKFVAAYTENLRGDMRVLAWADKGQLKEHPSLDNHLTDSLLYAWRDARHWNWEERERPPTTDEEKARTYASERKAKVKERIRRQVEDDNDDWIIEA